MIEVDEASTEFWENYSLQNFEDLLDQTPDLSTTYCFMVVIRLHLVKVKIQKLLVDSVHPKLILQVLRLEHLFLDFFGITSKLLTCDKTQKLCPQFAETCGTISEKN